MHTYAVSNHIGFPFRRTTRRYLTPQLKAWDAVLQECLTFIDQIDTVTAVNLGGGIGVPYVPCDVHIYTATWAVQAAWLS